MTLPGLSTIKTWALGLLAAGFAFAMFRWKASQLGRVKDKVAGISRARKTESRVNTAITAGLQNEQQKKNDRNYDDDAIV